MTPPSQGEARLVVVGASLAGISAVEGARSAGWTGPITVLGAEPREPYQRPALSKAVLTDPEPPDDTVPAAPPLRTREALAALDADLRIGTTALALDAAARTVDTTAGPLGYAALVIATGAQPAGIPGVTDQPGTYVLRSHADALRVRAALRRARRVVVIGAGFVGSEIASAAVELGARVTVLEAADLPLRRVIGACAAGRAARLHERAGVRLRCGETAAAVRTDGDRLLGVELRGGGLLDADAVIVGVGARPATAWLRGSAVALDGRSGAVRCDPTMATTAAGVWAAGDVASVRGKVNQHWTGAGEQGAAAGANAAGQRRRHEGVDFVWSTWHGHRIQIVGRTVGMRERPVDDGLIEYLDGDDVVGAFAVDRPGPIARLRRELAAATDPITPRTRRNSPAPAADRRPAPRVHGPGVAAPG